MSSELISVIYILQLNVRMYEKVIMCFTQTYYEPSPILSTHVAMSPFKVCDLQTICMLEAKVLTSYDWVIRLVCAFDVKG